MTDLARKLEQLEALSEKATQGEWESSPSGLAAFHHEIGSAEHSFWVAKVGPPSEDESHAAANAALIVAAVNFVRTELKELVGRAELRGHMNACERCYEDPATRIMCPKAIALEAAIGKPAGKDFIPPS